MFPIKVNGFGALLSFAIVVAIIYVSYQAGKEKRLG